MPAIESGQSIPPEELKLPETRVEVDLGDYNPTEEAVINNWRILPTTDKEDARWQLIESLSVSHEAITNRALAAKAKRDDPVHPDGSEFKVVSNIFVLRKMLLGHDWRTATVASQARIYINQKRKKIAQEILGLRKIQLPSETIAATIASKKSEFDELTAAQKKLDEVIAAGYPQLWEKIKPPATPPTTEVNEPSDPAIDELFSQPEPEQAEARPDSPEFLTKEAWKAIYETGLNYLETEPDSPDPKTEPERTGYFYIDPTNPNLSQELRAMAIDQDEILTKLEKRVRTEPAPDAREIARREIARRKKETSWDEARNGIRTKLNDELNDKIRRDESLATGDKIAIKDLIKPAITQYPTEAEARAILEDLKAKEPERAVAMYAQSEDGRPLKIFINKTNKRIEVSDSITTHLRPDYGQETKLITLIGSRVSPKKLSELKNK